MVDVAGWLGGWMAGWLGGWVRWPRTLQRGRSTWMEGWGRRAASGMHQLQHPACTLSVSACGAEGGRLEQGWAHEHVAESTRPGLLHSFLCPNLFLCHAPVRQLLAQPVAESVQFVTASRPHELSTTHRPDSDAAGY